MSRYIVQKTADQDCSKSKPKVLKLIYRPISMQMLQKALSNTAQLKLIPNFHVALAFMYLSSNRIAESINFVAKSWRQTDLVDYIVKYLPSLGAEPLDGLGTCRLRDLELGKCNVSMISCSLPIGLNEVKEIWSLFSEGYL